MDDLEYIASEISAELARSEGLTISEEHFRKQKYSYIVGNAFDVFSDPKTVTGRSVRKADNKLLKLNG